MKTLRLGSLGLSTIVLGSVVSACILSSPSDLPKLPDYPPSIVKNAVVPPADRPISTFPSRFVVPVRLLDPTVTFEYRAYVDYTSVALPTDRDQTHGLVGFGVSQPGESPDHDGVRDLTISQLPAPDPTRCHTIEILVAKRFVGRGNSDGHTPEPPGGDSVSWVYSPGGDLRGCPTFDAGTFEPVPVGDGGAE